MGSQAAAQDRQLSYSRAHEQEADRLGVAGWTFTEANRIGSRDSIQNAHERGTKLAKSRIADAFRGDLCS